MSFKNIVGQNAAVQALNNMIEQGQVAGAYLFLGPDGVGKRTVSFEFAKAVNCERDKKDACDNCVSCVKINAANHPDVFNIFPEKPSHSIKIEKIRGLIYEASLKPYEARKRFFIINDAESMTDESQNALLKLLEEPPENHVLVLTASNISGLFPTVVSRCKVLRFYSLNQGEIRNFLLGRGLDEDEAILFSHMSMGSLGKAMDFKDKDIAERRNRIVNDFFLRKTALFKENALTGELLEDTEESLNMLLIWYRDLLVSKFTQDKESLVNIDRAEEILSYSRRFSRKKLEGDISDIMETIDYIRKNMNPKTALFNLAVELKERGN